MWSAQRVPVSQGVQVPTWSGRIWSGIFKADIGMQRMRRAVGACRHVQNVFLH